MVKKLIKLFEIPAMLLNSSVEEGGSVCTSVDQNGDCPSFQFFQMVRSGTADNQANLNFCHFIGAFLSCRSFGVFGVRLFKL